MKKLFNKLEINSQINLILIKYTLKILWVMPWESMIKLKLKRQGKSPGMI